MWEDPFLYKVCADGMIRRCVPKEEYGAILHHCHDREFGGHFGATRTAAKVLQSGFIGQHCSRMPIGMSLHAINVKGHVISLANMKCQ